MVEPKGSETTGVVRGSLPPKAAANIGRMLRRRPRVHSSRLARVILVVAAVGAVVGGAVGYWNTYKAVKATAFAAQPNAAEPDYKASPNIYRVRAENDLYRIVEGTWKPGQRDQFHSHPALLWYWVTDCSFRVHLPGATRNIDVKAGDAGTQMPIASHSVENVGTAECRIVMFEQK